MLKKLAASLGVVLLASSFAFAGQTAPPTAPRVEAPSSQTTAHAKRHAAKKHHKHHKKHTRHTTPNR